MANELAFLQTLGMPQVLLWLLSFAVVYGVLSQIGEKGIPQSKAARAIIGIAIAFLVMMSAPASLVGILSQMSASLVLVIGGLLVLLIFLEVAGIRVSRGIYDEKTGEPIGKTTGVPIFAKYGYWFAAAFAIIAILIFVGSGGLSLLGWQISLSSASTVTIIFFTVIILAVLWMIGERGG